MHKRRNKKEEYIRIKIIGSKKQDKISLLYEE